MEKFPIVILPGWQLVPARYDGLAREFEKAGYKSYVVDFPGFGEGRQLTRAFNLTEYVKYLQKYLRLNKINKAILVCHSFGGRVALKFISQEPKRAAALVISGTPGFPGITKLRFYATVWLTKFGKLVSFIPPFLFFRGMLKKFFYRFIRANDYLQSQGFMRDTFKNIIKEQLIEYMEKIRVPTMLLWAGRDRLVPATIARRMQNTILNSRLVVVPGVGHIFVYREPAKFSREVIKFIKDIKLS